LDEEKSKCASLAQENSVFFFGSASFPEVAGGWLGNGCVLQSCAP